jgi:hypothetical protein
MNPVPHRWDLVLLAKTKLPEQHCRTPCGTAPPVDDKDEAAMDVHQLDDQQTALLLMSNDTEELHDLSKGSDVVLSSKDAYVWASALVLALKKIPEITDEQLVQALNNSITSTTDQVRTLLRDHDPFEPPFEEDIFRTAIAHLAEALAIQIDVDDAATEAKRAMRGLLQLGLILDPFDIAIGGVGVAIIGLIPTRFTLLTEAGRLKKLEIKAALYTFLTERPKGGQTRLSFELRLTQVIDRLRPVLIDAFRKAADRLESK